MIETSPQKPGQGPAADPASLPSEETQMRSPRCLVLKRPRLQDSLTAAPANQDSHKREGLDFLLRLETSWLTVGEASVGNISHLYRSASHRRGHWPSQALRELRPGAWFSLPAPPPASPMPFAHPGYGSFPHSTSAKSTTPILGPDQPLSSLPQARPLSAPRRALPAPALALAASLPPSSDHTRL